LADSNSPIHWHEGKRFVFNSDGHPLRSESVELSGMRYTRLAHLTGGVSPWWIEATHRDEDGTLFAWYHHEIWEICGPEKGLATPVIGAAISKNNGQLFEDLGFVLVDGHEPNCEAKNGYFASGHGDFSVVLDREGKYFYFFFSAYAGQPGEQGVTVARMAYEDRFAPAGKVFKYRDGRWESPGVEGPVSPFLPVQTPWESEFADAFWGPSVHYNRELQEYVMLLNRACCEAGWPQEGVYISFNPDLSNPAGWSKPERIIERAGWYPMVAGLEPGDTDKLAGRGARLFMGADSKYELHFRRGETGITPAFARK
jgi:hypothetical protein